MSTFVISDIHGHNDLFRRLLKRIHLRKSDRLILIGDMIDRGPQSKEVLDTVFLLLEHGFEVICIRGNHEQMFLDAFEDDERRMLWIQNGGGYTLESFGTTNINRIPSVYIDFIASTPFIYELGDFLIVHAGINMLNEDPMKDLHSLVWMREPYRFLDVNWLGKRKVVHGHTPASSAQLLNGRDDVLINIDNGVYIHNEGFGGLCALNLDTMQMVFEKQPSL